MKKAEVHQMEERRKIQLEIVDGKDKARSLNTLRESEVQEEKEKREQQ